MKMLYVLALSLSLSLIACDKREEDKVASTPDNYCTQSYGYGYYPTAYSGYNQRPPCTYIGNQGYNFYWGQGPYGQYVQTCGPNYACPTGISCTDPYYGGYCVY